jgi:hypothetical protein
MFGVSGSAKVAATAGLFAVAVATVVISAIAHRGIPLFFAWIPLVGVGWVLTRPEPAEGSGSDPASSGDEA